jgi:hypothetical protein
MDERQQRIVDLFVTLLEGELVSVTEWELIVNQECDCFILKRGELFHPSYKLSHKVEHHAHFQRWCIEHELRTEHELAFTIVQIKHDGDMAPLSDAEFSDLLRRHMNGER